MLEYREQTFSDYTTALRRRKWAILIPLLLGPPAGYGLALILPPKYQSQALVLIEEQTVPVNFVRPVVTSDLLVRFAIMQQQVLSRTRLQPLIERFGLYKKGGSQDSMEEMVGTMQKAVKLEPAKSLVKTREGEVPGFIVTFTYSNAQLAQQVCAEITSMFVEESLNEREQTAHGTTIFLQEQVEEAKRKLDEQDTRLVEFKKKHLGVLPDEAQSNLSILSSLEARLEAVTEALYRAQQDKSYAASLLADQLEAWNAAKTANKSRAVIRQRLAAEENRLSELQARYTDDHPDVLKTKSAIEQLKKASEEAGAVKPDAPETGKGDDTPRLEPVQIQQLRDQMNALDETIRAKTRQQERLTEQIKISQSRVQLSPEVEQEYKELTRDYQTALLFYGDLLAKKKQSDVSTDLESKQQGERFRVLDPADQPDKPSFPDRVLFTAGGMGGGLAIGLALALVLEMRDKSLRTDRDIHFYLQLPTLAMIPTLGSVKRKKWKDSARKKTLRTRKLVEA